MFQSLLGMVCGSGKASAGQRVVTIDGDGDDDKRSSVGLAGSLPEATDSRSLSCGDCLQRRGQAGLTRLTCGGAAMPTAAWHHPNCKVYIVGAKQRGSGKGGSESHAVGEGLCTPRMVRRHRRGV